MGKKEDEIDRVNDLFKNLDSSSVKLSKVTKEGLYLSKKNHYLYEEKQIFLDVRKQRIDLNVTMKFMKFLIRFEKQPITKPPGFWLNRIAETIYSKKTFENVLQPAITDMQDEYCEALRESKNWKALGVKFRGIGSIFFTMLAQMPVSGIKFLIKVWKMVG